MPAFAGPGLALPTPDPLRGIVFMVATVAGRRGLFPSAPPATVASTQALDAMPRHLEAITIHSGTDLLAGQLDT